MSSSPGQDSTLQGAISSFGPSPCSSHVFPGRTVAGLLHVRVLCHTPPPQVTVHSLNSPHSPQPPLTVKKNINSEHKLTSSTSVNFFQLPVQNFAPNFFYILLFLVFCSVSQLSPLEILLFVITDQILEIILQHDCFFVFQYFI